MTLEMDRVGDVGRVEDDDGGGGVGEGGSSTVEEAK